jgi:hypothetical protein
MPTTEQIRKTYVLEGFDHNSAFKDANGIYAQDPNVVVIQSHPGQSIKEAVGQIKGPANIILDCHGNEDGTFRWDKDGKAVTYAELFAALPREGIESVTLGSCYGESAEKEKILKAAPLGTIVQSMIGAHSIGDNNFITQFAENITAHKTTNSTALFLESLAVFKPEEYKAGLEAYNADNKTTFDANPEHSLPHMLGVGGGKSIDLETEMSRVVHKDASFNASAWQTCVEEVHEIFESSSTGKIVSTVKPAQSSGWLDSAATKIASFMSAGDNVSEHTSDKSNIDAVAKQMQSGQMPEGAAEKRIAYALTAAYLDKSGELEQQIEVAKHHGQEPPLPLHHVQSESQLLPTERPRQQAGPLATLDKEIFENHKLVTASRQSATEIEALEAIANDLHVGGIHGDETRLSNEQIKAIQRKLHVKADGKIGKQTMTALDHAEEILALPTPKQPIPAARGQEH